MRVSSEVYDSVIREATNKKEITDKKKLFLKSSKSISHQIPASERTYFTLLKLKISISIQI